MYFWICLQNFSWEELASLKCRETFAIISACNVSKNAALSRVFFCHVLRIVSKDFSKFFQFISTSLSLYYSNLCLLSYTEWKMQIFDPIACGNALYTVDGYQMMSYSHKEKYLNRNKHLNLKFWIKHLINCCLTLSKQLLLLPKEVKSLTLSVPITEEEKKLSWIFIFTLLCGAWKVFMKAFIKPFEATQRSVTIKIWLDFYSNTTFRDARDGKG